jgi:ClpX C4-type zinc finger
MFVGPGGRMSMGCAFCGRDLWEVGKYVSAGHVAICADCVEVASASLLSAADSHDREIFFPPRCFGVVPDDEAVHAIAKVFDAIFGGGAPEGKVRADYLEDAEELAGLFDEAGARHPGVTASARVDRIRFLDQDTAEVRFQLTVGGGPGPMFDGRVVRRDGRWLATRGTALRVLALGGVHPHRS